MDKPKKTELLLGLALKPKGKGLMADKPKDEEEEDEEEEGEEMDGDAAFNEAADKVFDTLESGDKEGFREALQAAIYACQE